MNYTLDPSFDDEMKDRIMANFCAMARLRAKDKRTLLKAVDETRSMRQHKYYFASLGILSRHMSDHFGITHKGEVWHEMFKDMYLDPDVKDVMGKQVKLYRTSTTLTKKEFHDYMERIIAYCAVEYGCVIPPPTFERG